ncbi:DUF2515 family protein [Burkholderia gladioli]|uniref:DUF2515 family protein n=1 Tax=Burkholderia gladioli TaxID=28095 RepID=UPI003C7CE3F6
MIRCGGAQKQKARSRDRAFLSRRSIRRVAEAFRVVDTAYPCSKRIPTKGNLWVFLEVTSWHLFYRKYGKDLFEHCKARRNVESYDPAVKRIVQGLPWAMGQNDGLKKSNPLWVIGGDMINDGAALAEFRSAIDMNDFGRLPVLRVFSGAKDPTLFFNASAEIDPNDPRIKSAGLGEDDIKVTMERKDGSLYNATERTKYVKKTLDKYHALMSSQRYRPYMIQQISTIAGWKDA